MKKLSLIILMAFTVCISCNKSSNSNTSNPATCSDGIQNQGETGVDCGGPCAACVNALCNGNGSADYLSIHYNNSWSYSLTGATFSIVRRVSDSTIFSGNKFYKVIDYIDGGTNTYGEIDVRKDASGNLKALHNGTEYTYIPASPTVNQTWVYPAIIGNGSRKVVSLTASISTSSCSYTGCLEIQELDASSVVQYTIYYKKGIGIVYSTDGFITYKLTAVTLN